VEVVVWGVGGRGVMVGVVCGRGGRGEKGGGFNL